MSTKSTIAHGGMFHFYRDGFDDDHVFLEVEGTQFEASCNRVMVPIPVHIWEVIRHYQSITFDFADLDDGELRQYVERKVDERIARFRDADAEGKGLSRLSGVFQFGSVDDPRDVQIESGMEYATERRKREQKVREAIRELADHDPQNAKLAKQGIG